MRYLNAVIAVLALFFAVTWFFPDILVLLLFVTGGLAFPLLSLNTVLLYLLAAWPALFLLRKAPRNWLAIGLAALLVPFTAFAPPFLADRLATQQAERLLADDVRNEFVESPRSVEIVALSSSAADTRTDTPCSALCQRLLLSGQVDIVRVTRAPAPDAARSRRDYIIEQRTTCLNTFSGGMLAETMDAVATGYCVVGRAADATGMAARVVLSGTSATRPEAANLREDIAGAAGGVMRTKTLAIFAATSAGWTLRLRQTQVTVSRWAMPLYLSFAPCPGFCSGKPVFGRSTRTFNPFDDVEVALQAMRLDGQRLQRLDPADRVMVMLDRATETLTPDQLLLIGNWGMKLWGGGPQRPPLSAKDEALALRLVHDRRIENFQFLGGVTNPRFVAANLDLLLDEMEARGANSSFSSAVGQTIAFLDLTAILPRRDRVLAIIRTRDWKGGPDIANIAGRLGVDTTELIAEKLQSSDSAPGAALAACLADDSIGRQLVPRLLAYLRARPVVDEYRDNFELAERAALTALGRFGHFGEAREIFLSHHRKFGEDYLRRYARVVNSPDACYL